jgi:error-prone DNA polymerase
MDFYRKKAVAEGMICATGLKELKSGREIKVAGVVICRQRPSTAKGFTFLTLEDETGMINIVINAQVCEKFSSVVKRTSCLVVTGILQVEQGVVNVIASGIEKLVWEPGTSDSLVHYPSHDFH